MRGSSRNPVGPEPHTSTDIAVAPEPSPNQLTGPRILQQERGKARLEASYAGLGGHEPASRSVFVGRQPIYDANRQIHAYELLFRREDTELAAVVDGDLATAQVLLNTFHIGLEKLSSDRPVFINCTRDVLMSEPMIPPDLCVVEVLEDIEIDRQLLERMRQLRASGYRLALDDFVYKETSAPAVELADYVKLDVLSFSREELRSQVNVLRRADVWLLAEKVDSESQLAYCRDLGFHFFQGYYLRRPDVLSSKRMQTSKLAALQLIAKCQSPDASFQDIALLISADVSMTFSLLRLANSAAFGGRIRIECLTQAISRLGVDRIVRWALLLAVSSDPDCPIGYLEAALQRAHMCELLSTNRRIHSPQTFYLVGLLSLLDSVFEVPMSDLLQQMPLTMDIKRALLEQQGELGDILRVVLAYDAGDWDTVKSSSLDHETIHQAYWHSVEHASSALKSLLHLSE